MNVLVLHGPNLDLLGRRPGDEPSLSLPALDRRIAERARRLGLQVRSLQSNHEGALVDALRNPGEWAEAVVLSPGLLALTSQVLREAVAYSRLKVVEVHLEDASGKHSVRRHSLLKDVCAARVVGEGPDGYLLALERLVAGVRALPSAPVPKVQKQALGRRERPAAPKSAGAPTPAPAVAPAAAAARPTGKTLGRKLAAGPGGRAGPARAERGEEGGVLSRAKVRARIAERLSGRLTPAGLSTWSRAQWLELQRGAPAESGQRELLEETLQQLLLGLEKPSRLSDEQLVELMTALDG
jgi:3-dehydroquinate dehydratase II